MYLRMTIDVAVFEDAESDVKHLLKGEGKAELGIGEVKARRFWELLRSGDIEIDDIRDIEDHSR